MHRKAAMTILALALGGCFVLSSLPASAQQGQLQQQKKVQGKSGGGGSAIAPRGGARIATPRASQRTFTQRKVRTATPRTFTQRKVRTATPRAITQRKVRTATPKTFTPKGTAKIVSPGGNKSVAFAGKLRGAARTSIRGHNFSVWRSGHRVRHGGHWRTFVALGTLSAIMIGTDDYYPYAYLSADEPYCSGLTDDGCQLRWQEVETIEGDVIDQCVAYCPWR